jgi:dolichyl-phosphate beta-glucosyltransferase
MSPPSLSVIVPAYNEAGRLPRTLRRLREHLDARGGVSEIIVVDDGSRDGTADAARREALRGLTVLRDDRNRGKGHAVRRGMLAARGELRLMTDADLSTPVEDLPRLLARIEEGYDVAIGSRAVADARVEVRQPWFRETAGRAFNVLVRTLVLPGLRDTQCGFKLWRGEAAVEAFALSRLDGFAFDVEVLFVARRRGRRIAEVPVTWRNDVATRVGALRGVVAFTDLLRIRMNAWAGTYDPSSGL